MFLRLLTIFVFVFVSMSVCRRWQWRRWISGARDHRSRSSSVHNINTGTEHR